MIRRIEQFRFYGDENENSNITAAQLTSSSNIGISKYSPIIHIGIQTMPGVRVYINGSNNEPIVVGVTGIYELDLENTTGVIDKFNVDANSLVMIEEQHGYLIIDIIYEVNEEG